MSIPPSQNQAIQMSIATNIGSQTAIFQQMNALLRTMNNVVAQLNAGFKALTQAILQNTTVMSQLAIKGGPNYIQKTLTGTGRTIGPKTQLAMDALAVAFENINKPILDLVGNITTEAVPALNSLGIAVQDKPKKSKKDLPLENIKESWGSIGTILRAPFKSLLSMNQTQTTANGTTYYTKPSLGSTVKGFASAPFQAAGQAMKPFLSQLSAMGPQMATLAIVAGPIMDFLNAFLEPLSILSEYFAGFGGILSQLLVPVMAMITPLLDAVMGLLIQLVPMLAPLMAQLFQLTGIGVLTQILIPLMPLISAIVQIIGALIAVFTPLLGIITSLVPILMNSLMPAITWLTDNIMIGVNWLMSQITVIQNAAKIAIDAIVGWITGIFDWLAGGNGNNWW